MEKVGWQRSNSTEDWDVEESNLLGNSALIYLNEPEFTEDPDSNTGDLCVFDDDDWPYVCDEGQITTCSGGLYTAAGDTTQTEWPCLRGWHFFNLQRDGERPEFSPSMFFSKHRNISDKIAIIVVG